MTYLERLKKSKTPTIGTAFTAKSPLDSKDSSDSARFQKNVPPLGCKDSSDPSRFQKIHSGDKATKPVPPWCRADCIDLEMIDLPNEGEVAGCLHPLTGSWRRLDWMTACPMGLMKAAKMGLPNWCRVNCENLRQVRGGTAWCCQGTDRRHWRISRIDRMKGCPTQDTPR